MRWALHMYDKYCVDFRHPRTEVAGLVIMYSEDEVTAETARLESLGYVVTRVLRPIGELPELPPPRVSLSGSPLLQVESVSSRSGKN